MENSSDANAQSSANYLANAQSSANSVAPEPVEPHNAESLDNIKSVIITTPFVVKEIFDDGQSVQSVYSNADPTPPKVRNRSVFTRLSLTAYSLGFGNVMLVPLYFANQGRVAFLVPLVVCYIFIGFPILLIEAVVGQYSALHPNIVFSRISPILNSIGGMFSMISFYRGIYFMPFAAYTLYVVLHISIRAFEPEGKCYPGSYDCFSVAEVTSCSKYWSVEANYDWMHFPKNCTATYQRIFNRTNLVRVGIFTDFVDHNVFNPATAGIQYKALVLLFGLWVLLALIVICIPDKIRPISSVIGIVALILTAILFCYTLYHGREFNSFFLPDWTVLYQLHTWVIAIVLTLYSLSLCDGGVIRLTATNSFNNNVFFDVLLTLVLDFLVSMIHIYIFSVVTTRGIIDFYPGVKNPDEIQQILIGRKDAYAYSAFGQFALRASNPLIVVFMCIVYYGCLTMLIFQSVLVSYETLLAAIIRRLKITDKWKRTGVIFALCIASAVFCSYLLQPRGTMFVFIFLDGSIYLMGFIALIEVIALMYVYGYQNFCANIEAMIGWRPTFIHFVELVTFKCITPAILALNVIGMVTLVLHHLGNDGVLGSAARLTFILSLTGFITAPVYIAVQIYKLYKENRKLRVLFMPASDWGRYQPVLQDDAFFQKD